MEGSFSFYITNLSLLVIGIAVVEINFFYHVASRELVFKGLCDLMD